MTAVVLLELVDPSFTVNVKLPVVPADVPAGTVTRTTTFTLDPPGTVNEAAGLTMY